MNLKVKLNISHLNIIEPRLGILEYVFYPQGSYCGPAIFLQEEWLKISLVTVQDLYL